VTLVAQVGGDAGAGDDVPGGVHHRFAAVVVGHEAPSRNSTFGASAQAIESCS
jgi:hypothetical protein